MTPRSSRPLYDVGCPTCKVQPRKHCRSLTTNRVTDTHNARLRLQSQYHAQKAEYEFLTANCLKRRLCPASGLPLRTNGNCAAISNLSCDVCDCFGYNYAEVEAARSNE